MEVLSIIDADGNDMTNEVDLNNLWQSQIAFSDEDLPIDIAVRFTQEGCSGFVVALDANGFFVFW